MGNPRDPHPDLPSTGCEQCDADRDRREVAAAFAKMKAEGKIIGTGEMRPCRRCGMPQEVCVAREVYARRVIN